MLAIRLADGFSAARRPHDRAGRRRPGSTQEPGTLRADPNRPPPGRPGDGGPYRLEPPSSTAYMQSRPAGVRTAPPVPLDRSGCAFRCTGARGPGQRPQCQISGRVRCACSAIVGAGYMACCRAARSSSTSARPNQRTLAGDDRHRPHRACRATDRACSRSPDRPARSGGRPDTRSPTNTTAGLILHRADRVGRPPARLAPARKPRTSRTTSATTPPRSATATEATGR